MPDETATDLDLFNYYALYFLELGGNFAPKQAEIDRMVRLLKQFFKLHMHKMLIQMTADREMNERHEFYGGSIERNVSKIFKDIKQDIN